MDNKIIEPIRHHYIPQFILKRFCFNEKNELYYYSKLEKVIAIRNTRDVFMENNLYRDNDSTNNPIQIEQDFSKFESEIAYIFSHKIIDKKEIELTIEENKKIKLFCALLSFRSKNTKEIFKNFSSESKKFYRKYQDNENFEKMWKRNLSFLVNCRSLEEVINNENIDDPIKIFMSRDTEGLMGSYFSFVEKRGKFDIVISDCYPVNIYGSIEPNAERGLTLMNIFPLTPNFLMMQIMIGAEFAPKMDNFKEFYKRPKIRNNCLIYHVRKIYEYQVLEINMDVIKNSKIGCAFQNIDNISFNDIEKLDLNN